MESRDTNIIEAYDIASNTWRSVASVTPYKGYTRGAKDRNGIVWMIGGDSKISMFNLTTETFIGGTAIPDYPFNISGKYFALSCNNLVIVQAISK